jgi:hypothetical protein
VFILDESVKAIKVLMQIIRKKISFFNNILNLVMNVKMYFI